MKLTKINNHQYRVGSNQHVKRLKTSRRKKISSNGMAGAIFVLLIAFFALLHYTAIAAGVGTRVTQAWAKTTFILEASAPTVKAANAEEVVTPTPTPTLPALDPNLTEREQNIDLIKKIWGRDSSIGLTIARCESGYRTKATNYNTNKTVDQGVFQINSVHEMPEMENAVSNISYAYTMFLRQGTNPWTSSEHCWGK